MYLKYIECYRRYINHLRKSSASYFGCEFFECVKVTKIKSKKEQENIDLILGVNENGLILIEPITKKIISEYKMEEILTYGFRTNALLLCVGSLMKQTKYQLATMFGKEIKDLLDENIDVRIKQEELLSYQILNHFN